MLSEKRTPWADIYRDLFRESSCSPADARTFEPPEYPTKDSAATTKAKLPRWQAFAEEPMLAPARALAWEGAASASDMLNGGTYSISE